MFLSTLKNRPADDNAAAAFCPAGALLRNYYYNATVSGGGVDCAGTWSAEKAACATLPALREERGKGHRNASYGRESVLYVIPLTAARRR